MTGLTNSRTLRMNKLLQQRLQRLLIALSLLCFGASLAAAPAPILVVDLSEAYSRSTALAGLLAAVDNELKALAERHRPELERLRRQLRELKQLGAGSRDQQLVIARRISDIETAAELEQDRLSDANQAAIAKVNATISDVKMLLKTQTHARAVLDIQETMYLRPDCPCIATEQLYELLNTKLPRVDLILTETGR